jgi:hypothetical protein
MAAIAESLRRNPDAVSTKPRFLSFALAGLIVAVLYAVHLSYCQHSTLQFLDAIFINSDMHANLIWAQGIREQGLLDPHPYHPWNTLLQSIAPYPQWVQWWGGEQVFQQSPLYTYILSAMMKNLFLMRILQAMMSIATCVFIGLFTARISGRIAGWIAFWLAALYAPFYAYTWPFVRDGLGWFLAAALLWALAELTHAQWSSARARRFSWLVGVLLGLGFLAKETYLLLIPVVWLALAGVAWERQQWGIVLRVGIATVLSISPLLVRNFAVGAPLLSSSNRFEETFIQGNAASSRPNVVIFAPQEMGRILYASRGKTLSLVLATIASHPDGVRGWLKLQGRKLLALLDPYELPDNLSFYFVASISPVVRLGLRFWMILAPGLAGILLTIWRRDSSYAWIWLLLPVSSVGLFIGFPLSRYRQSLMGFLIPCAAYFLATLWGFVERREFLKAAYGGAALLVGWALILGPLSRQPRDQYERPQEYLMSAEIFHLQGEEQKAEGMLEFVRQKFPGYKF